MDEKDFLENYLWPSENRLDITFAFPTPRIEGLKSSGDFIVQCELEDTFSTNIITKYKSDILGVSFVDVHKNTQNKITGVFVRLVGSFSLVKPGYPFLLLDAPVSNVALRIEKEVANMPLENIKTTVLLLLPQADHEQKKIFFDNLSEQAKKANISYGEKEMDKLLDPKETVWLAESQGADLSMIRLLREHAWNSYKCIIEQTKEKTPFDYGLFQKHMIFDIASQEHHSFKRKGLSVPVEAQSAFFSVMVSGV
jgi:hypothetical protein